MLRRVWGARGAGLVPGWNTARLCLKPQPALACVLLNGGSFRYQSRVRCWSCVAGAESMFRRVRGAEQPRGWAGAVGAAARGWGSRKGPAGTRGGAGGACGRVEDRLRYCALCFDITMLLSGSWKAPESRAVGVAQQPRCGGLGFAASPAAPAGSRSLFLLALLLPSNSSRFPFCCSCLKAIPAPTPASSRTPGAGGSGAELCTSPLGYRPPAGAAHRLLADIS